MHGHLGEFTVQIKLQNQIFNRLIVAGNVTLLSMNDFHNFQLTCEEPAKDVYVWKRIKYENIAGAKELPFKP